MTSQTKPIDNLHIPLTALEDLPKTVSPLPQQNSSIQSTPAFTPLFKYSSSKPELDRPRSGMQTHRILQNILHLEKISENFMDLNNERLDRHMEGMRKLDEEEYIKLKETLEAERDVTFWSIMEDIGNLFVSAVSTILGFSLFAGSAAPVVGGVMIAAGVLSIVNVSFKYGHVWDWIANQIAYENEDLKQKLITILPAVSGIVATVLGLSGSVGSWFYGHLDQTQKALAIVQTASNLITGGTRISQGFTSSHYKWAQSDLSFLQSKGRLAKLILQKGLHQLKTFTDHQMQACELAAEIVKATKKSVQITQQPV